MFINAGGKVRINAALDGEIGIKLEACRHVRLTGTGDSSIEYGFELFNASNAGIDTNQGGSDYLEIDHIEIHDVGAGLRAAQYKDAPPGTVWAAHDFIFHHCYIHNTAAEGTYIGQNIDLGGFPLYGVDIHHNKLVNIGYDALQVRHVLSDMKVHDNYIHTTGNDPRKHLGTPQETIDNTAGLNVGRDSTTGDWYNNIVINARKGAHIAEVKNVRLFNNLFINSGHATPYTPPEGAISLGGESVKVFNNTIVNTTVDSNYGIEIIGGSPNSTIYNNIIAGSIGTNILGNTSRVALSNNLTAATAGVVDFIDPSIDNYHLKASSSAVDTANNTLVSIFDLDNISRPQGTKSDIGAYEYKSATPAVPTGVRIVE
jgi:hypothetical protein